MSDFEPFDDELAGALRRRAGTGAGAASTAAAHDAVLHRAGAIRRRRAAIGGGGAMAVLALGGVLLLAGTADEIGPAVTGDVLVSFEESTTSVESLPSDRSDGNSTPVTVDLSIPTVPAPTSAPDPAVTRPVVGSSAPGATSPTASAWGWAPSSGSASPSPPCCSPAPCGGPVPNRPRPS
jgi:hypothetical protein